MKQIILGGKIMLGYFIGFKNDVVRVVSTKQNKMGKDMSMPKRGRGKYPKFNFMVAGERISADVHRVIAENLIAFPRPKCIPKKDWDATPQLVRDHIKSLYYVNHIDHDKYNCHPTNLEWVTSKGNANAYQEHKKGITK
jgi:hypothetical protein